MTTPNNQSTPPPGMDILTDYTKLLPEGAMRFAWKFGKWVKTHLVGQLPVSYHNYAIPITPTVPATGDTNNQCCMATFELGNGEYVSPCHLPKGHEGNHKGTCLGSNLIWPKGFSSEEEMVLSQRGAPGDTTNEKGGEQRQELPIPTALYSCGGSCGEERCLYADDLAWFPKVKLWLCYECSEDRQDVGEAEITLDKYLESRK